MTQLKRSKDGYRRPEKAKAEELERRRKTEQSMRYQKSESEASGGRAEANVKAAPFVRAGKKWTK